MCQAFGHTASNKADTPCPCPAYSTLFAKEPCTKDRSSENHSATAEAKDAWAVWRLQIFPSRNAGLAATQSTVRFLIKGLLGKFYLRSDSNK